MDGFTVAGLECLLQRGRWWHGTARASRGMDEFRCRGVGWRRKVVVDNSHDADHADPLLIGRALVGRCAVSRSSVRDDVVSDVPLTVSWLRERRSDHEGATSPRQRSRGGRSPGGWFGPTLTRTASDAPPMYCVE